MAYESKCLALAVLLFTTGIAWAAPEKIHKHSGAVPGEYIVVFHNDVPKGQVHGLSRRLTGEHGRTTRKIWTGAIKGFFAVLTEKEALSISRHPAVAYVEENASLSFETSSSTKIDPACEPAGSPACETTDNRLWHLDRIDQNSAVPSNTFAYCATGAGVRIYIVDSGVHGTHSEFRKPDGSSRVETGYNATVLNHNYPELNDPNGPLDNGELGDRWPANQPCGGWNTTAVGPLWKTEYAQETAQLDRGHGTAVAALAAGKTVGIAREATIVPVKVARCDGDKPRYRQPDRDYAVGDLVFDAQGGIGTSSKANSYWQAIQGGRSANVDAVNWSGVPGDLRTDNGVIWRNFRPATSSTNYTTQMLIDGLDWILDRDTSRTAKSVVSLSTSRTKNDDDEVYDSNSVRTAIQALLAAGIPVIASANNQDDDACDRIPSAYSRGNPYGEADDVITVGGTMLHNSPEDTATYDPSQPTVDRRWTCANPSNCTNGSNGGPCVTLFAPAHEITAAGNYGASSYRGRITSIPGDPPTPVSNSGTSWSAPLVAGVVAGYIQNGALPVDEIHDRLIADSDPILDDTNLIPIKSNGLSVAGTTTNLVLRAGSVRITSHPQNSPASTTGSTVLSATSNPNTGVTYQWYKVNSEFDLTKKRGAASSQKIEGATSSSYTVTPSPSTSTGYWVRVTGCGAADSDIAVVVPRPGAPTNVVATKSGGDVVITWSAGSGAEKYEIQRKVSGQSWTMAGTVDANYLTFTDSPTAPGGMVLYRVLSLSGTSYLPSNNLAASAPSNLDIANVNTYENLAVAPAFTTFKAQMIIELRQAVNTLADAAGITPAPFSSGELLLSSLQNQNIQASYLTTLMTKINSVRTNAAIGMTSASFTTAPASNVLIHRSFVEDLRNALQ